MKFLIFFFEDLGESGCGGGGLFAEAAEEARHLISARQIRITQTDRILLRKARGFASSRCVEREAARTDECIVRNFRHARRYEYVLQTAPLKRARADRKRSFRYDELFQRGTAEERVLVDLSERVG